MANDKLTYTIEVKDKGARETLESLAKEYEELGNQVEELGVKNEEASRRQSEAEKRLVEFKKRAFPKKGRSAIDTEIQAEKDLQRTLRERAKAQESLIGRSESEEDKNKAREALDDINQKIISSETKLAELQREKETAQSKLTELEEAYKKAKQEAIDANMAEYRVFEKQFEVEQRFNELLAEQIRLQEEQKKLQEEEAPSPPVTPPAPQQPSPPVAPPPPAPQQPEPALDSDTADGEGRKVETVFSVVAEKATALKGKILEMFASASEGFRNLSIKAYATGVSFQTALAGKLGPAADVAKEKLASLWNDISSGASSASSVIGKGVTASIMSASSALTKLAKAGVRKIGQGLIAPFKKLGASVKSFGRGLMRTLTFGLLFRPLRQALTKTVEAFGNALMSNQAFAASMNNLKGTVYTAFAPALNALAPIFAKIIDYVALLVTYISTLINGIFGLKKATNAEAQAFGNAAEGIKNTTKETKKNRKETKKAQTQFAGWDTIQQLATKQGDNKSDTPTTPEAPKATTATFGQDFGKAEKDLKDFIDLVKSGDWYQIGFAVGKAFSNLLDNINTWLVGKYIPFMKKFGENLGKFINGAVDYALSDEGRKKANLGTVVANFLNGLVTLINSYLTTVNWENVGKVFMLNIQSFVKTMDWGGLAGILSNAFVALFNIVAGALREFDPAIFLNAIIRFIKGIDRAKIAASFFNMIGAAWGAAIKLLVTVVKGIWKTIKKALTAKKGSNIFLTIFKSLLYQAKKHIFGNLTFMWNNMAKPFLTSLVKTLGGEDGLKKVKEAGTKILNKIGEVFTNVKTWIVEKVSPIIDGIVGFFSGKDATDSSKNVGEGILNGIASAFLDLGSWVKTNIFDKLIGKFKEVFGIASPAKDEELLKAAGYVGEGILNGIASAFLNLGSWVKKNIFEKIKSALTGKEEDTPTVTVNLDAKETEGFTEGVEEYNSVEDREATLTADTENKNPTVLEALKSGWEGVKDKTAELTADVPQKWADIKDKWTGLTENVKEETAQFKGAVTQKWADLKDKWSGLTENVKEETAQFKGAVTQKWADLKDKWTNLTSNVKEEKANFKGVITQKWADLKTSWTSITGNIKNEEATFKGTIPQKWEDLKKGWTNLTGNIKNEEATFKAKIPYGWKTKPEKGSSLADKWKNITKHITNKDAKFKADIDTKATDVKNSWDKVAEKWKNKEAKYTIKMGTSVKDLKDKVNSEVIDTINGKFSKIPILSKIKIPHLAQGGVVNPGHEFAAILGDNRHEQEIVSPLSTMRQAMKEALIETGVAGGKGDVILQVDGRTFARVMNPYMSGNSKRLGITTY